MIGQFFKEHHSNGTAEPNVRLIDEPLRQGEDLLVIKLELFENLGRTFLITADPVKRFGQNNVKLTRRSRPQERQNTRTKQVFP